MAKPKTHLKVFNTCSWCWPGWCWSGWLRRVPMEAGQRCENYSQRISSLFILLFHSFRLAILYLRPYLCYLFHLRFLITLIFCLFILFSLCQPWMYCFFSFFCLLLCLFHSCSTFFVSPYFSNSKYCDLFPVLSLFICWCERSQMIKHINWERNWEWSIEQLNEVAW